MTVYLNTQPPTTNLTYHDTPYRNILILRHSDLIWKLLIPHISKHHALFSTQLSANPQAYVHGHTLYDTLSLYQTTTPTC